MTKLFEAMGAHSRSIEVHIGQNQCYECQQEKACLEFDASDGEYSCLVFCKECVCLFFDGKASKSTYLSYNVEEEIKD